MTAQASERELLVARCAELLEWSKTGLLAGGKGGVVRELAAELEKKIGETYALRVAEDQIKMDAMREVVRLAATRAGDAPAWQPIETAPRDGTRVLLFWPGQHHNRICCGNFDLDQYNKKPEPYWSHDQERSHGKINAKKNPPTHWMSPPAPPISRPNRCAPSAALSGSRDVSGPESSFQMGKELSQNGGNA